MFQCKLVAIGLFTTNNCFVSFLQDLVSFPQYFKAPKMFQYKLVAMDETLSTNIDGYSVVKTVLIKSFISVSSGLSIIPQYFKSPKMFQYKLVAMDETLTQVIMMDNIVKTVDPWRGDAVIYGKWGHKETHLTGKRR